ncbi:MAG TPA: triose-phosphate isomerase, partial [Phototrophicaceae bacterium]|nr:triose-phosphate isomerase [Phototrophicaceae bacterium]
SESAAFVKELVPLLAPYSSVEQVVCPTFISVAVVADALKGTPVKVGAQNLHWEEKGAFTSQISATMLQGLVEYVIIGHSECREYLHETDAEINKKVKAALAHGLKPILAVGESDAQNQAGETHAFVSGQLRAGLADITPEQMANVVVAYEPIWAIGTGRSASGEIANNIVKNTVRATLIELYGETVAQSVRIQYGGSVKPGNMAEYMQYPDIDGGLVGGASLKVSDFVDLIRIAAESKS